jgi:hypothetical protein
MKDKAEQVLTDIENGPDSFISRTECERDKISREANSKYE